jgi:hypothetical protein
MKPILIAALGIVLCTCSSSDFHPYVGQQQKWPTSPGIFVDSKYDVPVYYGYPPRSYTVLGMMEETSHGRHSNAVADAAEEATKLGGDAVLVESHGSSSEPGAAFTNASITPMGSGAMLTGSTINRQSPHRQGYRIGYQVAMTRALTEYRHR